MSRRILAEIFYIKIYDDEQDKDYFLKEKRYVHDRDGYIDIQPITEQTYQRNLNNQSSRVKIFELPVETADKYRRYID